MARDHEINYYPHTPKQLQKKYERVKDTLQTVQKLGLANAELDGDDDDE